MDVLDFRDSLDHVLLDSLFPEDMQSDPFVAYHGTSSVTESVIERDGLAWCPGIYKRDDVGRVVSIYERINWMGVHRGGFEVLKAYSWGSDFAERDIKAVYLAETAERALLYASRDFAGGETSRALRHALDDLTRFLEDAEIRRAWRKDRWCRLRAYVLMSCQGIAHPKSLIDRDPSDITDEDTVELWRYLDDIHIAPDFRQPWDGDLNWLRQELKGLASLFERCQSCYSRHTHGVVYALRFDDDDMVGLEHTGCMGILAHELIDPSRIVAKALLPGDLDTDARFDLKCRSDELQRERLGTGVGFW